MGPRQRHPTDVGRFSVVVATPVVGESSDLSRKAVSAAIRRAELPSQHPSGGVWAHAQVTAGVQPIAATRRHVYPMVVGPGGEFYTKTYHQRTVRLGDGCYQSDTRNPSGRHWNPDCRPSYDPGRPYPKLARSGIRPRFDTRRWSMGTLCDRKVTRPCTDPGVPGHRRTSHARFDLECGARFARIEGALPGSRRAPWRWISSRSRDDEHVPLRVALHRRSDRMAIRPRQPWKGDVDRVNLGDAQPVLRPLEPERLIWHPIPTDRLEPCLGESVTPPPGPHNPLVECCIDPTPGALRGALGWVLGNGIQQMSADSPLSLRLLSWENRPTSVGRP